jgi:hypothetical protein
MICCMSEGITARVALANDEPKLSTGETQRTRRVGMRYFIVVL